MEVKLLSYTPNIEEVLQEVGQITRGSDISARKFFQVAYNSGHLSVLEHVFFTLGITCISRSCSHQLVRHRLVSYTQKSQRTHKKELTKDDFVKPDDVSEEDFNEAVQKMHKLYQEMLSKYDKEDARFVLPNCTSTDIIMTVNLRQLLHMMGERLCSKAQDEIRELFLRIKHEVQKVLPGYMQVYLMPKCFPRGCSEQKSCGWWKASKEIYLQLKKEWEEQ